MRQRNKEEEEEEEEVNEEEDRPGVGRLKEEDKGWHYYPHFRYQSCLPTM